MGYHKIISIVPPPSPAQRGNKLYPDYAGVLIEFTAALARIVDVRNPAYDAHTGLEHEKYRVETFFLMVNYLNQKLPHCLGLLFHTLNQQRYQDAINEGAPTERVEAAQKWKALIQEALLKEYGGREDDIDLAVFLFRELLAPCSYKKGMRPSDLPEVIIVAVQDTFRRLRPESVIAAGHFTLMKYRDRTWEASHFSQIMTPISQIISHSEKGSLLWDKFIQPRLNEKNMKAVKVVLNAVVSKFDLMEGEEKTIENAVAKVYDKLSKRGH